VALIGICKLEVAIRYEAMPGENRHQSSSSLNGHHMLDDYTIMEQQQQKHQPPADLSEPVGNGSLQELYAQLVQKERDLLLAAQLGKALLEKNEELGLQNEKMAEEYSRQLEVSFSFFFCKLCHLFVCIVPTNSSDNTRPIETQNLSVTDDVSEKKKTSQPENRPFCCIAISKDSQKIVQ
jgi:hypothetical protein